MRATRTDVRPAAVAGSFYPDDPAALGVLLDECLAGAARGRVPAVGAIVPHAGLEYSGPCAARVLARVAPPDVAVILAPNHTGLGDSPGASLWPRGAFATPLGAVPVSEPLADALLAASPLVAEDREAHRLEHAIEVELPLLQRLAPGVEIVPVVLAFADWPRCAALAEALARVVAAAPDRTVLLVASSDMTHYESAVSAAGKDRLALARIAQLDGAGLLDTCRREGISMCGRAPAAVVMEAARRLGAVRGELVDYRHSGRVTGDSHRVVSYAGVLLLGPAQA